jgi:hypothetical protein
VTPPLCLGAAIGNAAAAIPEEVLTEREITRTGSSVQSTPKKSLAERLSGKLSGSSGRLMGKPSGGTSSADVGGRPRGSSSIVNSFRRAASRGLGGARPSEDFQDVELGSPAGQVLSTTSNSHINMAASVYLP